MSNRNQSSVTLMELFATGRPQTGVYSFLLTLIGFKFVGWDHLVVGFSTAFMFALISMSIMTFNDLVDAENDRRKKKFFASDNRRAVFIFWLAGAIVCASGLIVLSFVSAALASFLLMVWLVGLFYSFVPHWYVVQNVIVALCSGCPVLCVSVYTGSLNVEAFHTFLMFTWIIWVNECYKDADDMKTDIGYKLTLPTELGWNEAWLRLVSSLQMMAALFFWHPNSWLQLVAVLLLPLLARNQVLARDSKNDPSKPLKTMNTIIKVVGLTLYVT